MNKFNDIEVIINNKRYTLGGYESEEYLQKIASFINGKHNEFRSRDAYKFLDTDLRNILIQINIADDFYKAKDEIHALNLEEERLSGEIFDLKHALVTAQTDLEAAQTEVERLKKELNDSQKEIVRLETEIKENKKNETKRNDRNDKKDRI